MTLHRPYDHYDIDIAFVPTTLSITNDLMEIVRQNYPKYLLESFESETAFLQYYQDNPGAIRSAVVFADNTGYNYSIRMNATAMVVAPINSGYVDLQQILAESLCTFMLSHTHLTLQ